MPQARLERVVVRVPHRGEITVAADGVRTHRPGAVDNSSGNWVIDAIFAVRAASAGDGEHLAILAHTQAKCRVAWIRLQIGKQPMPLGAHVGQAEQSIWPELTLNGKAIVFRIGKPVLVVKSRRAADGDQQRPVDVVVRVRGRYVQRWMGRRAASACVVSGRDIMKLYGESTRY